MRVYANGEHDPAFAGGPEEKREPFQRLVVNDRQPYSFQSWYATYSAALVTL
jgi:hypothetical protein